MPSDDITLWDNAWLHPLCGVITWPSEYSMRHCLGGVTQRGWCHSGSRSSKTGIVTQTSESPGWSLLFLMKDVNAIFVAWSVWFIVLWFRYENLQEVPIFLIFSWPLVLKRAFVLKSMQIKMQNLKKVTCFLDALYILKLNVVGC